MRKYCVYKHTSPNGKCYIGITCQSPKRRWDCGRGYKDNIHFTNAIRRYGWDNIKHEILLKDLTREEAELKEIELIALYKSADRKYGYNVQLGGNLISDESREKMRKAHIGKPMSDKARKILSEFKGEKHPFYGKHHTEEAKRSMSEKKKGITPWWVKGVPRSEEHKRKLSKALKGHKPSKEQIIKWRESNKHRMTPVKQIDIESGKILNCFDSTMEAYRQTNIDHSSIRKCCIGQRKIAGGYKWEYA